jgi:signal transduction histidine kinase
MVEHHSRLEMLGSAAAGIAHDINNHLMLILNHIETTDLEAARAAASRCTALTAGLLSWSRGESLVMGALDVAVFLRDFIPQLRLPADVQLIVDVAPSLPSIRADPVALHRALTNLVSNACEAMNGVGSLRIGASRQTIEVGDTGSGIALADQKKIFEPFVSTKRSGATGLGLAIVRDIMRQHGGVVTVESAPGKGAQFTLRFRL